MAALLPNLCTPYHFLRTTNILSITASVSLPLYSMYKEKNEKQKTEKSSQEVWFLFSL